MSRTNRSVPHYAKRVLATDADTVRGVYARHLKGCDTHSRIDGGCRDVAIDREGSVKLGYNDSSAGMRTCYKRIARRAAKRAIIASLED